MEEPIAQRPPPPPAIVLAGATMDVGLRRIKPTLISPRWVSAKKRRAGDRRSMPRRRVRSGAFALLGFEGIGLGRIDQMSMGDIACAVYKSRPLKMGQIRDISLSGISFSYIDSDGCTGIASKLDILVADSAFYLENLSFRTVTDLAVSDDTDFQAMKTKIACLQFKDLEPHQIAQLDRFLRQHTLQS
ncbi:MAG: hypothetical protein JEZ11_19225 [Desulfobacterales bacterium]|nr:hypothetical protein [Desulfobacterales bacterium]